MSDELRRIEREIRAWTARPPARPPRMARTRVLARIAERRTSRRWVFATAAGVMVALLAVGLLLRDPGVPPGPPPAVAAADPSPGLLVYELESGTKLYLALSTTSTAGAGADDTDC